MLLQHWPLREVDGLIIMLNGGTMSDVRRVCIEFWGEKQLWNDPNGTHALLPWEEYERLRLVVEAAEVAVETFDLHGWAQPLIFEVLKQLRYALLAATRDEPCQTCEGTGEVPIKGGVDAVPCATCGGTGNGYGDPGLSRNDPAWHPCPDCGGGDE
jgi:hypothetical protein